MASGVFTFTVVLVKLVFLFQERLPLLISAVELKNLSNGMYCTSVNCFPKILSNTRTFPLKSRKKVFSVVSLFSLSSEVPRTDFAQRSAVVSTSQSPHNYSPAIRLRVVAVWHIARAKRLNWWATIAAHSAVCVLTRRNLAVRRKSNKAYPLRKTGRIGRLGISSPLSEQALCLSEIFTNPVCQTGFEREEATTG